MRTQRKTSSPVRTSAISFTIATARADNAEEGAKADKTNEQVVGRPWELWKRRVLGKEGGLHVLHVGREGTGG